MPTTPNWGFPSPDGSDPVAIPDDIQALADSLDDGTRSVVMMQQGLLAARPVSGVTPGHVYYATDTPALYWWNGTVWVFIGPDPLEDNEVTTAKINDGAVTANKLANSSVETAKIADGAVTAAKIAGSLKPSGSAATGDEALRAIGSGAGNVVAGNDSRLSAGAAGVATVRALGTASTEAAAGDDVRITSSFAATRRAVRAVATSNITNLSSVAAGSVVSGITASDGDRFLLAGQSTASQNGIYVWNTGNTLTRATDMNASGQLTNSVRIPVLEGDPFANSTWTLTTTGTPTLGSSNLTFVAQDYHGAGTTAQRPLFSFTSKGSTYHDQTVGITYRNSGSAWVEEVYGPGSTETIAGAKTFSQAPRHSVQNFSGNGSVSSTGGKIVTYTGSGGHTITLHAAVATDEREIWNLTDNTFVVDPNGSETVNGSSNNITIPPRHRLSLVCRTNGQWGGTLEGPSTTAVMAEQGLLAARPVTGQSIKHIYFATDTSAFYWWDGDEWIFVGPTILETGEITSETIADNAITTPKINDLAVTTAKIADSNVTTGKIADTSVTTGKIANSAVTTDKINNSAVTSDKLASNSVTTAKITDANVTTTKIADANVTTAKIADANVTTAKIADVNVTTAKIANSAVTSDKINNGAVNADKISTTLKPSGSAGTGDEALRALGTASANAAAGDDVRITSAFASSRRAVRAVATSNIANLSSISSTAVVSGITASNGDRFLLAGQSTASQNGIYIWNTGNTLTRATDMNATAHLATGTEITVLEGGPFVGSTWVLTSTGALTLGSSNLTFVAKNYDGAGTTAQRPSATLVTKGSTYFDETVCLMYRSSGSAWVAETERPWLAAKVESYAPESVSTPGSSIDGVPLVSGDIVLLRGQATAHQNGLWVWNGAATAMTRPASWSGTVPEGVFVYVRQGTFAGRSYRTNGETVVGSGAPSLLSAFIGDGGPSQTITGAKIFDDIRLRSTRLVESSISVNTTLTPTSRMLQNVSTAGVIVTLPTGVSGVTIGQKFLIMDRSRSVDPSDQTTWIEIVAGTDEDISDGGILTESVFIKEPNGSLELTAQNGLGAEIRWVVTSKSALHTNHKPEITIARMLNQTVVANTFPQYLVNGTSGAAIAENAVYYDPIWIDRHCEIAGYMHLLLTAASYVPNNNNKVGLYRFRGIDTFEGEALWDRIAQSANDATAIWGGATGVKKIPFTSPVVVEPGLYAVARLINYSSLTTSPGLAVQTGSGPAYFATDIGSDNLTGAYPSVFNSLSGATDLPTTQIVTQGTGQARSNRIWSALYSSYPG